MNPHWGYKALRQNKQEPNEAGNQVLTTARSSAERERRLNAGKTLWSLTFALKTHFKHVIILRGEGKLPLSCILFGIQNMASRICDLKKKEKKLLGKELWGRVITETGETEIIWKEPGIGNVAHWRQHAQRPQHHIKTQCGSAHQQSQYCSSIGRRVRSSRSSLTTQRMLIIKTLFKISKITSDLQ